MAHSLVWIICLSDTHLILKIDWLDKARIYVAAQNLFVITGYKGLDPEVELFRGQASDDDAGLSPGIEPRDYMPKSRSFTFGVNLTF